MTDIHLDPEVLSALQEVMEDEYPILLETFLHDCEERLSCLHATDDPQQLVSTAHSFKGSSSNMGAKRLAELCDELEQCAKASPPMGIEQLVEDIAGEFAIVRRLYSEERQRFHC
ncbi:Hpt domain-containing protein [Pseudomonas purpurea]|uniref:Hpt domain-containing protein n=1 Tax=Pseudomonas purpurea TaxID=3136737 RepID=UPI0032643307